VYWGVLLCTWECCCVFFYLLKPRCRKNEDIILWNILISRRSIIFITSKLVFTKKNFVPLQQQSRSEQQPRHMYEQSFMLINTTTSNNISKVYGGIFRFYRGWYLG
jgi:hypothetical protein